MINKLLIVGYGRHGKDEAAQYLSTITKLRYGGPTSWIALPYIAKFLGVHPLVAWENRSKNREIWKTFCDNLRVENPALLAEKALCLGDIVTGVRDREELTAIKNKRLFDCILWVDRKGFPVDPTVTFSMLDCDEVINNCCGLYGFHLGLKHWAKTHGLLE